MSETSLRGRAIWAMLGPVLVALFIWEEPGFPVLMNALGLPSDPLIREIWEYFWATEPFPEYAVEFTDTFGLIAILGAFLKFWADDEAIEELGVTGGLSVLSRGDLRSIGVVLLFSLGSLWLIDYPLTTVALVQGGLIVVLYFTFTLIVTQAQSFLQLPDSTRDIWVKAGTFGAILAGCLVATGAVVTVMQTVEYVV